ncbi:hypothetical protein OOU_Y34scaffold00362g1, partial [Pyricularia oryzae Y34]
ILINTKSAAADSKIRIRSRAAKGYKPGSASLDDDKKPLCPGGVVRGSGLRRPDSPSHFELPPPYSLFPKAGQYGAYGRGKPILLIADSQHVRVDCMIHNFAQCFDAASCWPRPLLEIPALQLHEGKNCTNISRMWGLVRSMQQNGMCSPAEPASLSWKDTELTIFGVEALGEEPP